MRLALLSTPRSGNTWFRRLLATAYMLQERAVFSPGGLDWSGLPGRCIVQLHWRREEPLTSLLERHRFRVVVLSRHPLDVLISILHFARHEPLTARWLEGEGGDERLILDAMPRSPAFLEYATGPRAAALLSVSHEWRRAEGSYSLRYEDLARDAAGELRRLGTTLGLPAHPEAISGAIAANSMERLREGSSNQHFWQGRPGLWKHLLPAAEARRIAGCHRSVLDAGDYQCDPDESLADGRADCHWLRLELEAAQRALGEARAQLAASQSTLGEARAQIAEVSARLNAFEELGPTVTEIARRLRQSATRHPLISRALRRFVRGAA